MKKFIIFIGILLGLLTSNVHAMIQPDILYKSLELTAASVEDDKRSKRASIAFIEYYPKYNINRYLVFTKTAEKYIYCQQRTLEWMGKDVQHVLVIGERTYYIEYSKHILTYCWVDSKRYENPII